MEDGWEELQREILDMVEDVIYLNTFSVGTYFIDPWNGVFWVLLNLGWFIHTPKGKCVLNDLSPALEVRKPIWALLNWHKIFVNYSEECKTSRLTALESTPLRSQFHTGDTGVGISPLALFPEQSLHLPGKGVRTARRLRSEVIDSVSKRGKNEDDVSAGRWH